MTAAAETYATSIKIRRADTSSSILTVTAPAAIAIKAGTVIEIKGKEHAFETDTPITFDDPAPGRDYALNMEADGTLSIIDTSAANPLASVMAAGFHFAPRRRSDDTPAINPNSLWDVDFRPSCTDPRSMVLIERDGDKLFWADFYLLGTDHLKNGTSRCGATIANGRDLPEKADGKGRYRKLDYATAAEIYTHHGKRLLGAEEFFAAAYGVEERCSRDDEPTVTGAIDDDAHRFISAAGLFDATGTMWQWGTDGHPDDPRPSVFGGSWFYGAYAGSRYADLAYWPESSSGFIGARGASDHLNLA